MTCAKARVVATITTLDGRVFEGSNDCDNPQSVCPRIAAGSVRDDYRLCADVCRQSGHAEVMALRAFKAARIVGWGGSAQGATVQVGHWRCCGRCEAALRRAGVARIVCEAKRPTPIELAAQDQAKLARYLAEAAGSFPERPVERKVSIPALKARAGGPPRGFVRLQIGAHDAGTMRGGEEMENLAPQDRLEAMILRKAPGTGQERYTIWAEDWTVERQYHAMMAERGGA